MKIKVGKTYLARNGKEAYITGEKPSFAYCMEGHLDGVKGTLHWGKDGNFIYSRRSAFDLIEEISFDLVEEDSKEGK